MEKAPCSNFRIIIVIFQMSEFIGILWQVFPFVFQTSAYGSCPSEKREPDLQCR